MTGIKSRFLNQKHKKNSNFQPSTLNYYTHHSIPLIPCSSKYAFVFEKCLQPKNPLCTENGEGWATSNIRCFELSIRFFLLCANAPHKRNTTCSFFSEIICITASVKYCHQISWCDAGFPALTVKKAFKSNTHCSAHGVKLPIFGMAQPTSLCNSLKIFCKLGGCLTPSGTEKLRPCACQAPW